MKKIVNESLQTTVDGTDYLVLAVKADLARGSSDVLPSDRLLHSETLNISRGISKSFPVLIDLSEVKKVDLYGLHAILSCRRILKGRTENVFLLPSKPLLCFLKLMFFDHDEVVRSRKRFECLIQKKKTHEKS